MATVYTVKVIGKKGRIKRCRWDAIVDIAEDVGYQAGHDEMTGRWLIAAWRNVLWRTLMMIWRIGCHAKAAQARRGE